MTDVHTYYEVDVYVDSNGKYHLPLVWKPHAGEPRAYDFGPDGNNQPIIGYALTTYRSSGEDDIIVFSRAHDALSKAGFDVKPPRGYVPQSRQDATGREEAA